MTTCDAVLQSCGRSRTLPAYAGLSGMQIVTKTEAERWEDKREEREARARQFRQSVLEQYKKRGLEPPPVLQRDD